MHSRGAAAKAAVFACAIAAFAMAAATATVGDCTYTDPEGRKYDFSPLIANNGSYTWTQDSYEVGGKVRSTEAAPPAAMGAQLALTAACAAVWCAGHLHCIPG